MQMIKAAVPCWNNAGAAKALTGTFQDGIWITPPPDGRGVTDAVVDVVLAGTVPSILELQAIRSRDGGTSALAALPTLDLISSGSAVESPAVYKRTTGAVTTIAFWVKLLPGYSYRFDLRGTGTDETSTAIATADFFA